MVEITDLYKSYKNGVEVPVLKGIRLSVEKGEFVSILGPSGSGKTTLLNMIGLLDRPDKGRIILEGRDVTLISDNERALIRNRDLGFVFQYHYLLPEFTALENVMMPQLIGGKTKEEASLAAHELLAEVGLKHRLHHLPGQLSGGENQRVSVARALSNYPKIVIGDEPTGNLDTKSSDMIYHLLRKFNREKAQTFIIVTHDETLAAKTDRIVRIRDGRIEEPVHQKK